MSLTHTLYSDTCFLIVFVIKKAHLVLFECFRTSRPESVCSTYHFLNCSTRTWSSSPPSHISPAPDLASMWVPPEHSGLCFWFLYSFLNFSFSNALKWYPLVVQTDIQWKKHKIVWYPWSIIHIHLKWDT